MTDGTNLRALRGTAQGDDNVETLASRVLYVMASRFSASAETVDRALARKLTKAVLAPDAGNPARLVQMLTSAGIQANDITDHYVPYVARDLGEMWVQDEIQFTDVTIGAANLQGILRELNSTLANQVNLSITAPTVLMIVPEGETHTLGALVATNQLRRAGASVQLCVGEAPETAMGLLEHNDYDLVMISSGHAEGLEPLRRLIQNIRYSMHAPVPIVVGGPIVGIEDDLISLTKADMVTDRPTEALRLCMKRGIEIGEQKRA